MSSVRQYPRAIARQPQLDAAIASSGLDRIQLVNASGLSITYVTHIRRGLSVPLRAAEAVANALGVQAASIFNIVKAPPKGTSR